MWGATDVVDMLDLSSYSLPETEAVMVITPLAEADASVWLGYDRLFVQVRGRRGRR